MIPWDVVALPYGHALQHTGISIVDPFGGPIVLGFQLEALIEHRIGLHRSYHDEHALLQAHKLRFSNYQFTFASAVTCGQDISVEIKGSQLAVIPGCSHAVHLEKPGLFNAMLEDFLLG